MQLEQLHRARANVEDRIRAAKQTGVENLPFRDFAHNEVWLEIALIAQDAIAWTQQLTLDGDLATCEPKALRYRLLHTAGRLAFHARRATLRLQATWPWADALAAAFTRLPALPPPTRLARAPLDDDRRRRPQGPAWRSLNRPPNRPERLGRALPDPNNRPQPPLLTENPLAGAEPSPDTSFMHDPGY